MAGEFDHLVEGLRPGTVVAVGVPFDEYSSFMRGSALAPGRIRDVLHAGSTNLCTESGIDLGTDSRFVDLGDLRLGSGNSVFADIEQAVMTLLEGDVHVLSLGGDHTITYPILRAYGKRYEELSVLHLDAHPDLYDEFEGNSYSNACTFARVMEEGLVNCLVQIGIRATNPHQRRQAERFDVEVIEMGEWRSDMALDLTGPVYLSLDLDVLDPAFAPGVSHHESGGLSTRNVLRLVQSLQVPIVGADIVEFNPERDPSGITAMVAAKFLKEIAGHMIKSN